ncbi:MAG: Gfo/Idh/MocA family oxidoreductase [Verrucomicrobia bacterium]|nr:Gfo/Idh/MocA family oxidoreductase [Verrucomicrobiota bacterium]MBV9643679.1 Gfo/Idh/MocA family oxidoreductase [Verrucomicrobiota bacterium]
MTSKFAAIMVGCGAMSAEWIRSAKEIGVQISALVDLNLEFARARASEFQLEAPLFDNLDDAIRTVQAEVLFDCTVPAAHIEVDSKGLMNGLHVLEEKPLAMSLTEAHRLIDLAERNKLVHAVIQNRRFHPGVRKIRRLLDQGLIGEITTVNIDFFVPAHFGGFREKMDHILLADMAIHPFDTARYLIGGNAESVYCEEWNPKGSWWQHGASAHAIFRMTGGIRCTFRGSWCSEGLRTPWDSVWRIVGTKGTICWDGLENIRGEYVKKEKKDGLFYDTQDFAPAEDPDPNETRGHFSVMYQFLRDIEEGIPAETRSTDNIQSLAMVLGAIESAKLGQRVQISV